MASSPSPSPAEDAKKPDAEQDITAARRPTRLRVVHPDVTEFLLGARLRRAKKPSPQTTPSPAAKGEGEGEKCVRYDCAFEYEGVEGEGFAPPRMVWGKVSNHPWWPAQVIDPADASELARRNHRGGGGTTLVAYFWDKTFAWADAAALRPFRTGFPRLAAQSASSFAASVDAALAEVARRVDAGLSCGCRAAEKQQVIDNAGVRDGASAAAVDANFARHAFRGEHFVDYISALAIAPLAGADRLDLTVAMAQLRAFTRWRDGDLRGLPEYNPSHGIEDIANAATTPASRAKGRRPRGGDDGDASAAKRRVSRRTRARSNAGSKDVDDALELEGLGPSPQSLSHQMSTKIGKLMSRAARQMSLSPVIPRDNTNGPQAVSCTMVRCTRVADEFELRDDPLLCRLVLNFSSPNTIPSSSDLVTIYSQFGAIKEARIENFVATVVFERIADADAAFSGTSKISSLGTSLISFRLTYSRSASITDVPQSDLDTEGKGLPAY